MVGNVSAVALSGIFANEKRIAVAADAKVQANQFVHRRGSDRVAGAVVLRAGTRLGPPEIAVLAGG